jgi:hypothetical protein
MIITAAMMAGMPWMAAIFPATFVPLWRDTRKKFTNPRLARYEIKKGQDQRAMMLILAATIGGILVLVLGLAVFLAVRTDLAPAWLASNLNLLPVGIIGGMSVILMILAGLTLEGARRYLAYAGLLAALLLLTAVLDLSLVVPMFGAGLMMMGGGLSTLLKFFREFPL